LGRNIVGGWLNGRLFVELLEEIICAAEDDKFSEEEFQRIVATAKKVVAEMADQS
jgi:ribonuclease PH